jgi:hypothetical protein
MTPAIIAFSTSASGDTPPLFRTELAGIGRPWDADYDPVSDRLFVALVNGEVLVYDDYFANLGQDGPSRRFTPAQGGADISDNLHGIVYVERTDTLLLSDVGAVIAGANNDGELFAIEGASFAEGLTEVSVRIGGPATRLGNPVDIAYDGRHLYVAEKTFDAIHRFDDFVDIGVGDFAFDLAPSRTMAFTKPESISLIPTALAR